MSYLTRNIVVLSFLTCFQGLYAQSMRGLSPVNSAVCWASGSKGTIVKTEVGGEFWDTVGPKKYADKEFRDIHAYDEHTAIAMSSGAEAVVIRTTDGGKTWQEVIENNRKGVFLDAMHFNGRYGVIIGDPYYSKSWFLGKKSYQFDWYFSCDSGKTWDCKSVQTPPLIPEEGEALFAASGSNIQLYYSEGKDSVPQLAFISRGAQANFYINGSKLSYGEASESSGPFSMLLTEEADTLVIVGGDWRNQDLSARTAYYAHGDITKIQKASQAPSGYRSSVARIENHDGSRVAFVCTGPNGSDYSMDGGKTWKPVDAGGGYNVVASGGGFLWFMGNDGKFNKLWFFELEGNLPYYNK